MSHSLRDHYAGIAMGEIMRRMNPPYIFTPNMAIEAFAIADRMLSARDAESPRVYPEDEYAEANDRAEDVGATSHADELDIPF